MEIREFISSYRNHPVLFIGTGFSLRYLENSYTWDSLLKKIATELKGSPEYYLDLKSKCEIDGRYDFSKIAHQLEEDFNETLRQDRNGKFKEVNDIFYKEMEAGNNLSRLKIYISMLLSSLEFKEEKLEEISELKKIRKNIGSIITTNYDKLIEHLFDFNPLIGNDILLSNPYGSVYKIHGCNSCPSKIIITSSDYESFQEKYELIRAQLLSIFIHNPIIFIGYAIGDDNIKSLLKTIFTYVEPNSEDAARIRDNFLLVEYQEGSSSHEICEHDIDLEGFSTIRINKVKTDDFIEVYRALSELSLPISAMDIRKVQRIVKEIYAGGNIQVNITEDLDSISNSDKIIAIGSKNTISYQFQNASEMMSNYFSIVDESNAQLLKLINKITISSTQWFPVFAFSQICPEIERTDELKQQQKDKLLSFFNGLSQGCVSAHSNIKSIMDDEGISRAQKLNAIFWAVHNGNVELDDFAKFLISMDKKVDTQYRRLLCLYDLKKYGVEE
ncbi:SIR2 family protein [Pseudoalteromonas sp. CnMc7-15]|uniref:SIR2 family protein n=1 Tax=unclassified Pseudoalteromonas TaxID=194690 RepID=UPI001EF720C1|nr:SIR2 family protein [Pseudoalteromonas sp. CnMc7-15]MCG7568197.1 SIR2 family protein [Pseudoalteromonas sp. CnMc7-15]